MLNNIFGNIIGKVVENASTIIDSCVTTEKEREEAKIQLRKVLLDAEKEAFNKEVEDRKDARSLYKDDAIIQKILATLFTIAYFGITYVMFSYFVTSTLDLGEFEISFISTIFGAMSSKVNTIIDFFFGGSANKNGQQKQ
jgi:Na+/melibiose symporter-like transporter